ncbi:MAG: hypothetical protein ACI8ZB_003034 [Desulforhopalus sp.]|jgi:hypothetical protein
MNGISMKQTVMVMVLFFMVTTLKAVVLSAQQRMLIATTDRPGFILTITEKVMEKASQRIGMELEVKSFPGKRAFRNANSGTVDGGPLFAPF